MSIHPGYFKLRNSVPLLELFGVPCSGWDGKGEIRRPLDIGLWKIGRMATSAESGREWVKEFRFRAAKAASFPIVEGRYRSGERRWGFSRTGSDACLAVALDLVLLLLRVISLPVFCFSWRLASFGAYYVSWFRIGKESLKPGDHIYSRRTAYIYAHHGRILLSHPHRFGIWSDYEVCFFRIALQYWTFPASNLPELVHNPYRLMISIYHSLYLDLCCMLYLLTPSTPIQNSLNFHVYFVDSRL